MVMQFIKKFIKWKHIQDEQPAHGEEIVQCNPPYEGHYAMGMRKYYQNISWKEFVESCNRTGWPLPDFYWISAKDFPFPKERSPTI